MYKKAVFFVFIYFLYFNSIGHASELDDLYIPCENFKDPEITLAEAEKIVRDSFSKLDKFSADERKEYIKKVYSQQRLYPFYKNFKDFINQNVNFYKHYKILSDDLNYKKSIKYLLFNYYSYGKEEYAKAYCYAISLYKEQEDTMLLWEILHNTFHKERSWFFSKSLKQSLVNYAKRFKSNSKIAFKLSSIYGYNMVDGNAYDNNREAIKILEYLLKKNADGNRYSSIKMSAYLGLYRFD